MKTISFFLYILFSINSAPCQTVTDSVSLKESLDSFIRASDGGDISAITDTYDLSFKNIRVTDKGEMITLTREQILTVLQSHGRPAIPTLSTTVHHLEVIGNMGFVLLTRIKDLGNGWEPMFYSLVWRRSSGNKWLLLREFVHQKSLPSRR